MRQRATKSVWFLVVRTSMLNLAGPWEVLGHVNDLLGREAYSMRLLGPGGPTLQTRHGLCLSGVEPLPARIDSPPHTVVVAGGSPENPIPANHLPLIHWLRVNRSRFKRVVSVCTGAFVLAEAGILDGRRATTHWRELNALRERFPKVHVVDEGIYVADGSVWTSAGLTAGVDLMLALVEEDHGHALAMRVAKRMVLFLRRSGQQAQFSSALQLQEQESPELHDLSAFVFEHLDEPLSVERIAEHVGMSVRTLSRWCRKQYNQSPAELVRQLRVSEARRLLEETPLPLKEITTRTGLGDQSTLWRAFVQDLGITPAEYRQRFAAAGR